MCLSKRRHQGIASHPSSETSDQHYYYEMNLHVLLLYKYVDWKKIYIGTISMKDQPLKQAFILMQKH